MAKQKIAIIGASYLQEPLIQKAKARGIETHVFAWAADDVGEKSADYFYPISITEKEEILEKCKEIGIDGICTIASDLAAVTVGFVANELGLVGNTMESVLMSTNKHLMRQCFEKNGDPSPKSILVNNMDDLKDVKLDYPIIVKPTDRSGSRGITKLYNSDGLIEAIERAVEKSFENCALVEEFVTGKEYSVEYISWKGKHSFLSLTQKYTTGAPNFIETGHLEPALVDSVTIEKVRKIVEHALDTLGIEYGASHSEIKISDTGEIKIIEIGARMGGDNIGSSLVNLSTGYDFVSGVIDVSLGIEPIVKTINKTNAAIRFVLKDEDRKVLETLKANNSEMLLDENVQSISDREVCDSNSRFGYFMFASNNLAEVKKYLPTEEWD